MKGQLCKEVLRSQIYMPWTDLFNIHYFIHSLNGNGLIGFTGTTAALLVYSFCWQPHQIEQRGKRKWTKSNVKGERDFSVLMLVSPSWTLQRKASHKTTDRALLLQSGWHVFMLSSHLVLSKLGQSFLLCFKKPSISSFKTSGPGKACSQSNFKIILEMVLKWLFNLSERSSTAEDMQVLYRQQLNITMHMHWHCLVWNNLVQIISVI